MIKSLRKLQHRYNLIETEFFYGRNAAVRLCHPERSEGSKTFGIPANSVIQLHNKDLTMRLKHLLLAEALLKSEGKDLDSMSQPALAKRFNVHVATIHTAFKDLRKHTE